MRLVHQHLRLSFLGPMDVGIQNDWIPGHAQKDQHTWQLLFMQSPRIVAARVVSF